MKVYFQKLSITQLNISIDWIIENKETVNCSDDVTVHFVKIDLIIDIFKILWTFNAKKSFFLRNPFFERWSQKLHLTFLSHL